MIAAVRTDFSKSDRSRSDNPKSRLEAPPTQCPRCKTLMKVRKCVPLPGRKFVEVDYRCDEGGAEVPRQYRHLKRYAVNLYVSVHYYRRVVNANFNPPALVIKGGVDVVD
jgi:hypothetical protein